MTVTVTTLLQGPFTATGNEQEVAFAFKVFDETEIGVYYFVGAERVFVDPSDLVVDRNTDVVGQAEEGGSITLAPGAITAGEAFYVLALPSFSQGQVWSDTESRLRNLNEGLDRGALRDLSLLQRVIELETTVQEIPASVIDLVVAEGEQQIANVGAAALVAIGTVDAAGATQALVVSQEGLDQIGLVQEAGASVIADVEDASAALFKDDVTEGLSETVDGEWFKTVEDGRIITYKNVGGVASFRASAPKTADIEALEQAMYLVAMSEEEGGGFAIVDDQSKIAMRIDNAGVARFFKMILPATAKVTDDFTADLVGRLLPGGAGLMFSLVPDEADYAFVIVDQNEKIKFGLHVSNRPPTGIATEEEEVIAPQAVIIHGDSMSAGNDVFPANHWPAKWAGISGRSVTVHAVNGQSSAQIAARVGSAPTLITVTGDEIPASGPVLVTSISVGVVSATGPVFVQGWLNGILGNLASADGGVTYTFERTVAGIDVPCPPNTPFCPKIPVDHADDLQVLWAGRNDTLSTLQTVTLPILQGMAAWAQHDRFLILGVCNKSDGTEDGGSTSYNRIVTLNNTLRALYGPRFFDVRRWLIDEALAAAGLTPTVADTAAIALDTIPPQLLDPDEFHLADIVEPALAEKINEIALERGF